MFGYLLIWVFVSFVSLVVFDMWHETKRNNADDMIMAGVMSLIFGLVWPVTLFAVGIVAFYYVMLKGSQRTADYIKGKIK
jgi:hypothetical protein